MYKKEKMIYALLAVLLFGWIIIWGAKILPHNKNLLIVFLPVIIIIVIWFRLAKKFNEKREEDIRESLASISFENGGNVAYLKKRDYSVATLAKIKEFTITNFKFNPEKYLFISSTVGGITTGGITKLGGDYSARDSKSGRFMLYYNYAMKDYEIETIVLKSPELIEDAQKRPVLTQFLIGDTLVLKHDYKLPIELLQSVQSDFSLATEYLNVEKTMQHITEEEATYIHDWMCGRN